MPWRIALAAALLAACQFEPNHSGMGYRCDSQHRCPEGTECVEMVCVGGVASPDGAPGGDDDGGGGTLDDGLVAYWPMDEDPQAGAVQDATGGHTATCDDCPSLEVGAIDGAWRFDGVDDVLRAVDSPDFRLDQATISAWVWLDDRGDYNFFGKPVGSDTHNSFLLVTFSGRLYLELDNTYVEGPDLPTETWVHVVATWSDGGRERSLRVSPDTDVAMSDGATIDYDGQPLHIGADCDPPGGLYGFLGGMLDDVRLYDRVLDADELDRLYEAGD